MLPSPVAILTMPLLHPAILPASTLRVPPMTTVLRRLVAPALIVAAAATLPAVEDPNWSLGYLDLRVGWSSVTALDISESLSSRGQDIAVVDWEGVDKRGNHFAATVLGGKAGEHGGFFWGAGLGTTRWDATPVNGYSANTATYGPGFYELTDWYTAVELQAGWQYGIRNHNRLQAWVEVAPTISAGFVQAETETRTGGLYRVDSGSGFGYEYGVRAGVYVGEKNWMAGLTGGLASFRSEISIDTADVGGSELVLRSVGSRIGFEAGYRF